MKSVLTDDYVRHLTSWTADPGGTARSVRTALGIPVEPLVEYEGMLISKALRDEIERIRNHG